MLWILYNLGTVHNKLFAAIPNKMYLQFKTRF